MGKQGGQGKGKPKLCDRHFGKALMKSHARCMDDNLTVKHKFLGSVLETDQLNEYIVDNTMENKEQKVIRAPDAELKLVQPSTVARVQKMSTGEFSYSHLKIPRKPAWNRNMTAEEVDYNEKGAFLAWRREIATLEENSADAKVTPFEKNLEVWRQLWRVMERSSIAFQIVDARNPLLYYTDDLIQYGLEHSVPKPVLLLLNKADFLTAYQRRAWAVELEKLGIKFAFYSAKNEQEKIDKEAARVAREIDTQLASMSLQPVDAGSDEDDDVKAKSNKSVNSKVKELFLDDDEPEEAKPDHATSTNLKTEESAADEEAVSSSDESSDDDGDDEVEEDDEHAEEDDVKDLENDEEFVKNLADDLVRLHFEYLKLSKQHSSQAAKPINKTKKSKVIETCFVWGDGSETVTKQVMNSKGVVESVAAEKSDADVEKSLERRCRVLNRDQLIQLMTILPEKLMIPQESTVNGIGRVSVGLVGFPNVGKSSVINTILGVSKSTHNTLRVAVSSTPGKTKHFQTLNVNDNLTLCDCPGLVFPSFMRSTGEMLCGGVLPINQMRDYVEPANIIAARIPIHLLDAAYGIKIQRILDVKDYVHRPPTGHELLAAYCSVKGYITNSTGNWDEFRASKEVIRDFNDGKILFVASPPSIPQMLPGSLELTSEMRRWLEETEVTMLKSAKIATRMLNTKKKEATAAENDQDGDSDSEEGSVREGKREHKRLKRWGKKSRKLRDRNPYEGANPDTYVAYTTNRFAIGGEKQEKHTRNNPRKAYGSEFGARAMYPHHPSVKSSQEQLNKL